jgi:hypothetical protein
MMLPWKGGEKDLELDKGEKSLNEVSFAEAFIEIKSQNADSLQKCQIKCPHGYEAQTDSIRTLSKPDPGHWLSTPSPKRNMGIRDFVE